MNILQVQFESLCTYYQTKHFRKGNLNLSSQNTREMSSLEEFN